MGKRKGEERAGEGREQQLIFAIVCNMQIQMLDLSGHLTERGVQCREGRREREAKKEEGRDRKWRSEP